MSPERLSGDSRSRENDMWSVGATFVRMVTGQDLNHLDNEALHINKLLDKDLNFHRWETTKRVSRSARR